MLFNHFRIGDRSGGGVRMAAAGGEQAETAGQTSGSQTRLTYDRLWADSGVAAKEISASRRFFIF